MRYKKILIPIIAILLSSSVWGQKDFEVADVGELELTLNKILYTGYEKILFKNFVVKDFRFDSTKFGYYKKSKVIIKNNSQGFSDFLNEYYKKSLDSLSDKSIVVILKKLWIQRDAEDIVSTDKIRPDYNMGPEGYKTGACIADFDVFCQVQDNFYPLIKIKDNFFYYPYNPAQMDDFVLLPFDSLVRKTASLNVSSIIANRKYYSWDEINKNYSTRFEMPVLTTDSTTKGVFLTFESFKKNETIYPDFSIKKSKLSDELYIKENESENLLLDFWGYYDGKDYYIKSGFNFYKLTRQNNTWDTYGSKFITEKHRQFSFGTQGTLLTRETTVDNKFLQLDMETGKVY